MGLATNVQYYDLAHRCLAVPQSYKVRRILEYGCLVPTEEGWECLPIAGYNTRTYTITKNHHFECGWECNCQGFQSKVRKGKEPYCSHINALRILISSDARHGQAVFPFVEP